jgi:hypothetical protein
MMNGPDKAAELEDLPCSAQRGRPFGDEAWVVRISQGLGGGELIGAPSIWSLANRLEIENL